MQQSHMLQSEEEIAERQRPSLLKAAKQEGRMVKYGEELAGEGKGGAWDLVALLTWGEEKKRHEMYCRLMKDFDAHCVDVPIEELAPQQKANYERRVEEHEDDERRLLKTAIKQAVWFTRTRAFSIAGLKKLQAAEKLATKKLQVLRDQVNIRVHVDRIKAPIGKKEGAGGWLSGKCVGGELAQLQKLVEKMVKEENFPRDGDTQTDISLLGEAGRKEAEKMRLKVELSEFRDEFMSVLLLIFLSATKHCSPRF